MVVLAVATRDPVPSAATIVGVERWHFWRDLATVPKLGGAAYIALGRMQSCPQKSP